MWRSLPRRRDPGGWIDAALDRETPFKCTAGLHRAVRHTGDDGFEHHGFLNVLVATRLPSTGAPCRVADLLEEREPPPWSSAVTSTWPAPTLVHLVRLVPVTSRDDLLMGRSMTEDGFGLDHLPYGVFSVDGGPRRVGVRHGDTVVDLAAATGRPEMARAVAERLPGRSAPQVWRETRAEVAGARRDGASTPSPLADVTLHLPFEVADYVDFYASEHHATNVGRIFRPDGDALLPNWRHLPVGYHGRAGTVVASGTPVVRPSRPAAGRGATYGPSRRLDLEAELGFVVGVGSTLGHPGPVRRRSPTTSSASSGSTTGRRATSRPGSTSRSGPSSASPSPRPSRPGSPRCRRWTPPGVDLPGPGPRPLPYLGPGATRGLDIAVEVEVNGEVVSRPSYARRTGRPPRCSRT